MLLEMLESALRLAGMVAFVGLMIWVGVGSVRGTYHCYLFNLDLELKEEQWMAKTASG